MNIKCFTIILFGEKTILLQGNKGKGPLSGLDPEVSQQYLLGRVIFVRKYLLYI